MAKPSGYILYDGPSLIDGSPIVAIATIKSSNVKTGAMVQTWILRSDMDPISANRTGADVAICGTCPHRGVVDASKLTGLARDRSCYVTLAQAPNGVYKGYKRGIYPVAVGHAAIAALGVGKLVRLGSYGDPAAVPSYVWDSLRSLADGHTAYTHQSGVAGADVRGDLMMVSADSLQAAQAAWSLGHRTFRIVPDVASVAKGSEVLCPASEEAGRRATCSSCKLCGGSSVKARSVAIVGHGSGVKYLAA